MWPTTRSIWEMHALRQRWEPEHSDSCIVLKTVNGNMLYINFNVPLLHSHAAAMFCRLMENHVVMEAKRAALRASLNALRVYLKLNS